MIYPELHYEINPPELRFVDTLAFDDNGDPINEPCLIMQLDRDDNPCDLLYILLTLFSVSREDAYMDGYIKGLADGRAEAEADFEEDEEDEDGDEPLDEDTIE